ncbi:MAG TPA: hypothetical protein PKM65_05975 [Spirochaetota bacterium]|nr:hypothetical protein [Spirochaetota bacterium]HNT10096.1 hypothetical protein [Spirochaetota bacterium]HNV47633.1 hypothetical protein [Spirochaetota bacterium]HOS38829.1 hypothetical protein [Spirochaetota bacterium]HPU86913.1 hypothetical protein [Spirochaetota bacterium]
MADETNAAQTDGAASQKTKKINRLPKAGIEKKIAELEEKGQTRSVYYKHLVARRSELNPS